MAKRIVNAAAITQMGTASNASFQRGLASRKESAYKRVSTRVNSTTGTEEYGWLGKWPRIREWLGERIIQQLKAHSYSIKNKKYESTIAIDRDDVEDDNVGLYAPMFEFMGEEVGDFPDELVFSLLKKGDATNCYDGQFFFDTDHPIILADGSESVYSNWQGGAGPLWILMDASRALKPIIHQVRREFETVMLDKPDDPNVFTRGEYVYGVDGRMSVGFGLPQFAVGSRQPLTAANYELARNMLSAMKGDGGRTLNVKGNLLAAGTTFEGTAGKLLNTELGVGGETNQWKGTAELLLTAWLDS